MALTTEARVRSTGGFNHEDDFNMFRFSVDAEFSEFIANKILVASAWIQSRILSGIYSSSDPNVIEVVTEGETYMTLHFMMPHLKARRVMGTHYAVESESSDRYQELIDVEYLTIAQELLGNWLVVEVGTVVFARPTLRVGRVIDVNAAGFETVEEELEETLDRARSLVPSITG
jgi:hypothetical protein